jgi:hypothetical protein
VVRDRDKGEGVLRTGKGEGRLHTSGDGDEDLLAITDLKVVLFAKETSATEPYR